MKRNTTEYTHRARHEIRDRIADMSNVELAERLEKLHLRIDMLVREWSTSAGDDNATKRKHIVDCVNLAKYEVELIEERISGVSRHYGGDNKHEK